MQLLKALVLLLSLLQPLNLTIASAPTTESKEIKVNDISGKDKIITLVKISEQPSTIADNVLSEVNSKKAGEKRQKERRCKRDEFWHIRGKHCVPFKCYKKLRNIDTGDCNGFQDLKQLGIPKSFQRSGGVTHWNNKANNHVGMRNVVQGRGGKKGR